MSKFGIHHFNIFQHGSTMSNDNLWLTCSTQGSYQPSIPLQPALDGPWASLGAEPCQANVFFSTAQLMFLSSRSLDAHKLLVSNSISSNFLSNHSNPTLVVSNFQRQPIRCGLAQTLVPYWHQICSHISPETHIPTDETEWNIISTEKPRISLHVCLSDILNAAQHMKI